jgi:hypothetical protein
MSFCPRCGRPRGANARFCGGCGTEFGQPAADGEATRADGQGEQASEPSGQAGGEQAGSGRLTANVSFTSRQSPANSVDGSACNDWHISLYLVPYGTTYVMTAAPGDYHAGYSDC